MRMKDLSKCMMELNSCAALSRDELNRLKITPNDIKFFDNNVILECKQSGNGDDFSISVGGREYLVRVEDEHPGVQAYILLVDRTGAFVNQITARELNRRLNGYPALLSDRAEWGPYHWVDRHFQCSQSGIGRNVRVSSPPWERSVS